MAKKEMMKIGQRIKQLREDSGMDQKELAKKVGILNASLSDYENDKSEPSLKNAMKLAEALGVSIDFLVKGEKEPLDKIIEQKTGLTANAIRTLRRINSYDMDYADIISQLFETQEFLDAITEIGTAKQIILDDASQSSEDLVSFIRMLNRVHKSHGGSNESLQIKCRDIADYHTYEAKDKMRQAIDSIMKEVLK